MRSLFIIFPLLTPIVYSIKFIDQISNSAVEVLHGSQRSGMVRQCTCAEMSECYELAKNDAVACFDPCWDKLDKEGVRVSSNVSGLKSCFDERKVFIDRLVNCFKIRFKACAPTMEKAQKVQVHQYDYKDMVNRVEEVIDAQLKKFLQTITAKAVKEIVGAAGKLGKCVKECFLEKYKDGFCFDKKHCEPNISDKNAKSAIKQCGKQIDWKDEVGDLCKCSAAAGVGGISDYCGMLTVIG